MEIAERHNLLVIEDAAQGVQATYRGRALGSWGHMAALSFHETKNVICGEGGALLINDDRLIERAEIIREKGTNRSQFFRGQVDKYTWVDIGSSFLPSEINAAFLYAQLEEAQSITANRMQTWYAYHEAFADLEEIGVIKRPKIIAAAQHNAHMYYLLFRSLEARTAAIKRLAKANIQAVFHYVPLHSAPAGERFGRTDTPLPITDMVSECLLRLPMWVNISAEQIDTVVKTVAKSVQTLQDA